MRPVLRPSPGHVLRASARRPSSKVRRERQPIGIVRGRPTACAAAAPPLGPTGLPGGRNREASGARWVDTPRCEPRRARATTFRASRRRGGPPVAARLVSDQARGALTGAPAHEPPRGGGRQMKGEAVDVVRKESETGVVIRDGDAPVRLGLKPPVGSGEPLVVRSPWDGHEVAQRADDDAEGARRDSRPGGRRLPGLQVAAHLEALQDPRPRRTSHRGASGADRASHSGRGRQAAEGRPGRGESLRVHLPLGGRRGQADGRRGHRDARRRERAGPFRLDDPRAPRRDRRHLAVQLPPQPGGPQGGARPGQRQCRGPQARLGDAADLAVPGAPAR